MDKMDLTRASVRGRTDGRFPHRGREEGGEKKRRQSNCLLRVTVTFCLVPGKGAVLTLVHEGKGDGSDTWPGVSCTGV